MNKRQFVQQREPAWRQFERLVSRLGSVSNTERTRRLALHILPAEERDADQTKKTQRAAIAVSAFGVFVSAVLLVFYVHPYQAATGTLRSGNQLDWLSGEALLSLGWAALFVPCGIAAYRMIGRAYSPVDEGAPQAVRAQQESD